MTLSTGWIARTFTMAALLAIGCYGSNPSAKPASGANKQSTAADKVTGDMSGQEGDEHATGPALSEEDQALAALQKLCPVSGEELGGMGPPVKLTVKGEPIFICCKGCEKKVNAEPDKYLAKVAELKKANQE